MARVQTSQPKRWCFGVLVGLLPFIAGASCAPAAEGICESVPPIEDDVGRIEDFASNMADPAWLETRAVNCLKRWGYRLAASNDDGPTVAKAVMHACAEAARSHAQAYAEGSVESLDGLYAPNTLSARERVNYLNEQRAERLLQLEAEAHFRVQQGKVGKCRA